jgi:uncharacterized membrane protein YdbT with pleckstrin-like domain
MRDIHLREGERVLVQVVPHWVTYFWHIVLSITIVWIPVLLMVMWLRRSTHYVLTNYRVLVETGVLSKSSKSSQLDKINDVSCTQSVWGRMLGFGDVVLETAGEMGATRLASVPEPIEMQKAILDAVARARHEIGQAPADHSQEKKCEMCAEWVKAEAKLCRFCGHSFAAP